MLQHCFCFSDIATWSWRMWRRCGQRFQRAGRARRSPSPWTRIAIFLKCSCGATLSSSCWGILWSQENELFGGQARGDSGPFARLYFYVYVFFSWFKVSGGLTLGHQSTWFCWHLKPFWIFHFSNKIDTQIEMACFFFRLTKSSSSMNGTGCVCCRAEAT